MIIFTLYYFINKIMEDKIYYTYDDIHNLVKSLSTKIIESDFKPDYILAIGGGGFIPARIMRTFINVPIISLTINYYIKDDTILYEPNIIQWIDNLDLNGKKILIVDEVDDTRKTMKYIVERLTKDNITNLAVAVLHNKEKPKTFNFSIPYFYSLSVPDKWIVYPWDLN